jgi:hypothetical protein
MSQGQSAAGADLAFVSEGQRDAQTGRDEAALTASQAQGHRQGGSQIESGGALGGHRRQRQPPRMRLLDDLHRHAQRSTIEESLRARGRRITRARVAAIGFLALIRARGLAQADQSASPASASAI